MPLKTNFLTKSYNFKQPVTISKLTIELINMLGQRVNMNYMDFSFALECEQIYDSNIYNCHNFIVH